MNRSHVKYISGLILFGLNGVVSSQIILSGMNIVLFRTLLGSVFLMLLFAWQRQPLQPLVFHKKITAIQKLCFGIVFFGIIIISIPDLLGSTAVDSFGLLCGFASAVLHALMVIFTMKAPEITGLKNSMIQLVVSFLTVAMFAVVAQGVCAPSGLHQWGWILLLGIVNTGIGCYLYFAEIARLPVETVSILGYLEPLSAVVFAVLLLHEHLSAYELLGAVLIACGAVISERVQGRQTQQEFAEYRVKE